MPAYFDLFDKVILKDDIVTVQLEHDIGPEQMRVLNFNYTATAERYFKTEEITYIHGELNAKNNPLIFGFGDELDEDYVKIENENIREFLAYIKSFWYFKTSNYHDLIRFIEADDFQVFILGHSCGLSDRTMLKMIFEHENCKSIKLFAMKTKRTIPHLPSRFPGTSPTKVLCAKRLCLLINHPLCRKRSKTRMHLEMYY